MTRYVVLLRAVNLGSRNKVPMADLRRLCTSIGCTDVTTYIASGNVVLSSDLDELLLRGRLESAVAEGTGVRTTAMVRTAQEMAGVLTRCPFPAADDAALHVAFFHSPQDPSRLDGVAVPPEEVAAGGREVYLHLPHGLGRSPLPAEVGRRTTGPSTLRTWRTVTRLTEMAAG